MDKNYDRLLVSAWLDGGEITGFALVDITTELRGRILNARELFQMAKSKDVAVEELRLADFVGVRFFEENCNLDPEEELEEEDEEKRLKPLLGSREYLRFQRRQYLVVPCDFGDNIQSPMGVEVPNMRYTDYDVIVVGEKRFWWESTDEAGSIATIDIPYDSLISGFRND